MQDFSVALKFAHSTQSLDLPTFINLIDDNCRITYKFNGSEKVSINKKEYVDLLITGHFNNTSNVDIVYFTIEKDKYQLEKGESANGYLIYEDGIFERLGKGKDEDGPGKYHLESSGLIFITNGKVTLMDYIFDKKKVEP